MAFSPSRTFSVLGLTGWKPNPMKACFDATPKPARETGALPRTSLPADENAFL